MTSRTGIPGGLVPQLLACIHAFSMGERALGIRTIHVAKVREMSTPRTSIRAWSALPLPFYEYSGLHSKLRKGEIGGKRERKRTEERRRKD